jgi:twitching motility two-component system response regulator PilH
MAMKKVLVVDDTAAHLQQLKEIVSDAGYQVITCREITRSDDTSEIPVVFVSTKNQRADHIWAEKQGAKALLTKPIDSDAIVKQLNTYI